MQLFCLLFGCDLLFGHLTPLSAAASRRPAGHPDDPATVVEESLRFWERASAAAEGGAGVAGGFEPATRVDGPHRGAVTALAHHPSAALVVTASLDGEFKARGESAVHLAKNKCQAERCGEGVAPVRRALTDLARCPPRTLPHRRGRVANRASAPPSPRGAAAAWASTRACRSSPPPSPPTARCSPSPGAAS